MPYRWMADTSGPMKPSFRPKCGFQRAGGLLLAILTGACAGAVAPPDNGTPPVATDIPLTARPHMNAATRAAYDRLRTGGWTLGIGALGGSRGSAFVAYELWEEAEPAWHSLYGAGPTPAMFEFDLGEGGSPTYSRHWISAGVLADQGGLPWFRLTLKNFTVPFGPNRKGTAWDSTGYLAPVLPGGAQHGAFLAYVTQLAQEFKAFGRPAVFRPLHEMNGRWFWWGHQPAGYRQIWTLVFDVFRQQGVANVIWAWAPSVTCVANTCDQLSYYPGDDQVDIIGVSDYFTGPAIPIADRQVVSLLEGIGLDKPVMFTELGPAARADFWTGAPATFAGIARFRGAMLWLARGWQAWGSDPAVGSLIDGTDPPEVRSAFQSFLHHPRVRGRESW